MIKKGLLFVLILLCLLIISPVSAQYYYHPQYVTENTPPDLITTGKPIGLKYWVGASHMSGSDAALGYSNCSIASGKRIDGTYYAVSIPTINNTFWNMSGSAPAAFLDGYYFCIVRDADNTIISSWFQKTYPPNVTFSISDSSDFSIKLPNVTITLSNGVTGTTDSSGNVTFTIVPPSTGYTYSLEKTGYFSKFNEVLGGYGTTGGIVYNTMLSGAPNTDYYITVSPAWIPSTGSQYLYGQIHKQGYSGTNLTEFNTLSWSWHKIGTNGNPDGLETPYIETTNSSNHLTYSRTTGIYKGWSSISNAFSNVKTGALPNPLSLNPIGATGSILTTLLATDTSGNNYKLSVSNLIGDNTTTPNNVKFIVQDAYTGYRVYPSQLSVRNDATGVWWNVTTQYGEYEFILPVGAHVTEFASANGYTNVTNNIVIEANMIRHVNMYPSSFLGSPDKSELLIYVRSSPTGGFNSLPLEDSYVSITQVNNSIVKSDYTGVTGIVSFSVNKSTAYTITASKTGYTSGTQTINTAFINPYEAYIYLTNLNVISPTTTPTPFITATPIPTVIGGSVRNLTASTCGVPTGSMTIVEIFKQNIACWGVETREAQDLVLAGIIIAFFAFVLSKWGKGLGALIGGSIGFILSLAAGLIPVWAFFALVIIAGLIFGLKLYSGGK